MFSFYLKPELMSDSNEILYLTMRSFVKQERILRQFLCEPTKVMSAMRRPCVVSRIFSDLLSCADRRLLTEYWMLISDSVRACGISATSEEARGSIVAAAACSTPWASFFSIRRNIVPTGPCVLREFKAIWIPNARWSRPQEEKIKQIPLQLN